MPKKIFPMKLKAWTDQPDFDSFEGICDLVFAPEAIKVQVADVVWKGEAGVAVSAGSLFGSQTIFVPNYREALHALMVTCLSAKFCAKGKDASISAKKYGWKLLPNHEEKDDGRKKKS